MISTSLQIRIGQELPDPRNFRKEVKKFRGMQERNQLRAGITQNQGRAQIELPDMIVVMADPVWMAGGRYFENNTVKQVFRKQIVDNQMRIWLR